MLALDTLAAAPPPSRARMTEALYSVGHRLLGAGRCEDAADVFRLLLMVSPGDERGWVALGACHEALAQDDVAKELYATGRLLARPAGRCEVALARLLRNAPASDALVEAALDRAEAIADASDDDDLRKIVEWERGALS